MSARLLSLLAILGVCFLLSPQPAFARDPVDDLCHRHCAGEYDKLVTAKKKLADLEKRMEEHDRRIDKLDKESRALNGKLGNQRRKCAGLKYDSADWEPCQKDLSRLEEERNKVDDDLAETQSSRNYMEKKHKKLEDDVDDAQQDYNDCMKKCKNDPKIQEKIPDSVLGDLSTPEQRRKWKEEAKAKEAREEAAKAKCPACEKARTAVAREEDRLNELDKEYDKLEAERRKLRGDQKGLDDHEKLNRLRQEKGRKTAEQAKKMQEAIDEQRRANDARMKAIDKEQDKNESAQDAARRDIKRAKEEQKKCNDKCTSGDKKSFLQGVLPGLSFGFGMGGGRHHRREPERYEGGEFERR